MNGVKFGFMHSYSFLDLVLTSKEISTPEVKTNFVDIQGADGHIDLTYVFGEPKYKNREIKLNFTINPALNVREYISIYDNVQTILHAKKMKITFDEDAEYYYYGMLSVGNYKCEKGIATFDIVCDCEPFKTEVAETIVTQYVDGAATIQLYNLRKRVVPEITSDSELLFKYDGVYYQGFEGTFTIPEIELKDGWNTVEITGVGNVTFTYQKGRL